MEFFDTQVLDSVTRTIEGYINAPAIIGKAGIQIYNTDEPFIKNQLDKLPEQFREKNKNIRILRPLDVIFDSKSMRSFANKPITNSHPSVMITKDNVKNYIVGLSSNVEKQDTYLKTNLTIWDKETIALMDSGKKEISLGYRSELEPVGGVDPIFGEYDMKFKSIEGNHIAIVDKGRAEIARILDEKGKGKMAKRTVGNVVIEIEDDKVGVIDNALTELENIKKQNAELAQALADKTKESEIASGKITALEANVKDAKHIDNLVNERLAIIDSAKKLVKEFKPDGLSNEEIKKAVIAANMKDFDLTGKSSDFIDGIFDTLVKVPVTSDKLEIADQLASSAKNKPISSMEARQAFIENQRNAWKGN